MPRFPADIKILTGIVGAAGGLGGFLLPSALGLLKDLSGSYATGLLCFSHLMVVAIFSLLEFGVQMEPVVGAARCQSRTSFCVS